MSLMGLKYILILGICAGFVAFMTLAGVVHAGAECASLGGECNQDSGGWDPLQKLDEIGNATAAEPKAVKAKWPEKSRVIRWHEPAYGFADSNKTGITASTPDPDNKTPAGNAKPQSNRTPENASIGPRSSAFKTLLVPIDEIPEGSILLDISENSTSHIPGSVAVPYTSFLDNASLRSADEIAQILGDAGISQDDQVVVYGECMPCGGGPAPATYVYWIMKSMGQKDVRVLDGRVEDWKASGKTTTTETATRPPVKYAYDLDPAFSASFEYVKSGSPQIVDARTMQEFGAGGIPKAINIPYESVILDRRIKDEAKLERIFTSLKKDRPVVVYTATGIKASVVWFALELMGYDARLYSYENWIINQAIEGNATLSD
jgi:thiosulfate/3-mercaptopyruvate sulfurtransferase